MSEVPPEIVQHYDATDEDRHRVLILDVARAQVSDCGEADSAVPRCGRGVW